MSNPRKQTNAPAVFFIILALHIGLGYALYQKATAPVKMVKTEVKAAQEMPKP